MNLKSLLSLLCCACLLAACNTHKTDSASDQGSLRLINLSADHATLDLYSTDSAVTSGVASGSVGAYANTTAGTLTLNLKRGGSSTTSLSLLESVAAGSKYSVLAYTSAAKLQGVFLSDSESAPSSGYAKLRVINTATEAGNLDVYLTDSSTNLADASPTVGGIAGTGSYVQIGKGSYRIRVTGADNKTDLRLDIPAVTIADQQVLSLVLTTTPGGVLVDGYLVAQGGALTAAKNTMARIRLAADIAAGGNVSVTANDVVLGTALNSPAVGAYVLVPAGALNLSTAINGASVSAGTLTAAAGTDSTLLAMGSASAPQFVLLDDDNAPAASSYAKIRLVNGINGDATRTLTLLADYAVIASEIAAGAASSTSAIPYGSSYRLDVTASTSSAYVYSNGDTNLLSAKVYTLFMLGDAASPVGLLRRDR